MREVGGKKLGVPSPARPTDASAAKVDARPAKVDARTAKVDASHARVSAPPSENAAPSPTTLPPDARLFPQGRRTEPEATPPTGKTSWLALQAERAPPSKGRSTRAPKRPIDRPTPRAIAQDTTNDASSSEAPLRVVERHLQVLLGRDRYSDARKNEWASTPDAVRRHPVFVKRLLAEEYDYPKWVSAKGDDTVVRTVLADAAFAATLDKTALAAAPFMPEATLLDPAVSALLLARVEAYSSNFSSLPELLRKKAELVQLALSKSYGLVKDVPLEGASPALLALVEEKSREYLAGGGAVEKVPALIRARPGFLESVVSKRPLLWLELSNPEKARVEPLFREAELATKAAPVFAKRFTDIWSSERTEAIWAGAPGPLLRHPDYLAATLVDHPEVASWARLSERELDALFRAPSSVEGKSIWSVARLASKLSVDALARPHLRAPILEAIGNDTSYLKYLPPAVRHAEDVVTRAIGRSAHSTLGHVTLRQLPPALAEKVEDQLVAELAAQYRHAAWERVPGQLADSVPFALKLARAVPTLALPEPIRTAVAEALSDPAHVEQTIEPWLQRLANVYWSDQERVYRETPPAVRQHSTYARGLLRTRPSALEWAMAPEDRRPLDETLADLEYLTDEKTRLFELIPYLRPELQTHRDVRAAMAKRIAEDARGFEKLPEALRRDPACARAALAKSIYTIGDVPLPPPGDPFRSEVETAWIRYVTQRNDPKPLPAELLADPKFVAELLASSPQTYPALSEETRATGRAALDDPRFWEKSGQAIFKILPLVEPARHDDPRVLAALVGALAQAPWSHRELPATLKARDEIVEAILAANPETVKIIPVAEVSPKLRARVEAAASAHVGKNSWNWRDLPADLRRDPRFLEQELRKNPALLDRLDAEELALTQPVLADPELVLGAPDSLFSLLPKVPEHVHRDPRVKALAMEKVEARADYYTYLPPLLQREPRAVIARVVRDKQITKVIPREALTAEVLLALLERSPSLLGGLAREHLPDDVFHRAEEGALAAIAGGLELSGVPSVLRTDRVKRAVLDARGMRGFDGWGLRELLHDPVLWAGTSREQITEYLTSYPERLEIIGDRATGDPDLATLVLSKADVEKRSRVASQLAPELWGRADFVDRVMALDASYYQRASAELRADPDRARQAIHAHPANLDHALVEGDARREILRSIPFGWSDYGAAPWNEEAMLRELRSDQKAKVDLRTPAFAAAALGIAPAKAAELPQAWLENPAFVERVLAVNSRGVSFWPLDRLSPEGRATVEALLVERTKEDPRLFAHLPATLRADRALAELAVREAPDAILSVSGASGNDEALWRLAIDGNAALFDKCPTKSEAMRDYAVRATVTQLESRKMAPKEVPEVLYRASYDAAKAAMRGWGGYGIQWFGAWLKYPEVAQVARELILQSPELAAAGLEKVTPELSQILARLPRDPRTGGPNRAGLRFAITLADRTPGLVANLPPELRDAPSVRGMTWSIDPPAGAVLQVKDEAERRTIVLKRPQAIAELPIQDRTHPLVLAAVATSGDLLRHASPELRDDLEVVLAAVSSHGDALRWASDRLRANPEVVARAVRVDPRAIAHSLVRGPEARNIELIAVREGGLIDDRLERLGEQDFVLAFAEHLADNRYTGKVELLKQSYRFEHHYDDPAFVQKLLALRPGFLTEMPERYHTPENLRTAASRNDWYLDYGKGAFDPKTLPTDAWEELARAFPERFVRTFSPKKFGEENLPALKKAVLAAIHQDHRAMTAIDASWWRDDAFVAAAVQVNPLVLERFGPSRRRWLEELQPKAVRAADDFIRVLNESGFERKRFVGRFPLLKELLDNRFHVGRFDERPVAVVVYPKHDHNGAFDKLKFVKLTEKYRVMYYEAKSAPEVAHALRDGTRFKPADVVILAAHGSPESLSWGDPEQRPDQPPRLRPEHATMLAELVPSERLRQDAKVIFDACSVGGGGKHRRNLVNVFGEVWPHVWLQAAWFDSSSGNRLVFHEDGTFDRMDFRNADTLRPVPYHVGIPTRFDRGEPPDPRRRGIA